MKHHLLKSVILSLILVMGVSNAWAKKYYFEVPNIPEWKGKNALYAVRLCKGAGINTGTGWARLTQWDENTYYMDFKSTTYTHFQFCRMKDDITSLEGDSWMNLVHTSCYTMPSPIPTDNDEHNLLTVGSVGDYDNSNKTQTYSAVWDYQTFTVKNVHIILDVTSPFWRFKPEDVNSDNPTEYAPMLLIGNSESSTTIPVTKIENSYTIYHYYIEEEEPIEYTGYTFIQPAEADANDDQMSFHERCAKIDQIIEEYHRTTVDPNTGKTFQAIILNKHEDESTYATIVNRTKQRTKSYFEPIIKNVLHNYQPGDFVDSKTYFDDIRDLNKNLTIEVKVSYDGGATYEQTGTLPLRLYTIEDQSYQPKTWYFNQDWDRMDQCSQLNLEKGDKTFSHKTQMGYRASNTLISYADLDPDKYKVVQWIMNNTPSTGTEKKYQPAAFEIQNPVITLLIQKINNWKCTVTFNTDALDNNDIQIDPLEVEPSTKIAAPIIDKELQSVGMVCKWYTETGEEFDFDTHITQDYELYGRWVREAEEGDYRLLYVEQVVEKSIANGDEWKTIITRKKAHPSDIIKKRTESGVDTVSLHVYNKNTYQAVKNPKATNDQDKYYTSPSNSAVILQRYNGTTWEDKEHHMVFGPMETLPTMAMLPGRRNTEGNATLKYDDGIPAIQTDEKYNGNGVWNFPIAQTVNGGEVTATLERNGIKRYSGKYYIRTANADGGWNDYTIPANHMTFSEYQASLGLGNEEFTHYFCKWVDLEKLDSKYVHYVVANEYAQAVSDTLIADRTDLFGKPLEANQQIVGNDAVLPTSANIRFSWREENNALHRAYLAPSVSERFLVVQGNNTKPISTKDGQNTNEEIFHDISNWVYHADVQMQPRADIQVTAKYNEITQYFIGDQDEFRNTVLQGTGEQKYLVRLLYDFKNNELISAYVPGGNNEIEPIQTNLMLIRTEDYKNSEEKTNLAQLGFTNNEMQDENQRAYGVLEITKNRLTSTLPYSARTLYWVSFPFDVRVSDVFSSAVYGKHWIIQSYNGAKRAAEGLYLDSDSNWEYHFDPNTINANNGDLTDDGILKKGVGYVVALNYVNIQKDPTLANADVIGLYFPSTTPISNHIVNNASITIDVPAHSCNINKREVADSHWNVIGVPAYKNAGINFTTEVTTLADVTYYYRWLGERNSYQAVSGKTQDFNPLHSYMVQYHGNLNWTSIVNEGPASLTAKRNTEDTEKHQLRLELQQNAQEQDRTFIQLQDEEATAHFDFNYDLCKIKNTGANIYSIISTENTPIQVAGNVMPIQETIIPIGIKTDASGEYTFAMPEGTDGIVVELIDYEANTRTNMLLDNYTVNLGKGTFDNRFALHVKPDKTTTSVDNIGNEATGDKVKKYLIDGILYMQKDGVLYDAQGKLVR